MEKQERNEVAILKARCEQLKQQVNFMQGEIDALTYVIRLYVPNFGEMDSKSTMKIVINNTNKKIV